MAENLPDLQRRESHVDVPLSEEDVGSDPIGTLWAWLADAEHRGQTQFNAMVLATVGPDGHPSARNVLLRGIDDDGRLRFFTNRESRKGTDMASEPHVGLLFSWLEIFRQVRVDGVVSLLPTSDSDAYFATRPRGSQLADWASEQSSVIPDRAHLEARVEEARRRFEGVEVHPSPHWSGWAVTPLAIEFWQGRSDRLHDRIRFRRDDPSQEWTRERLAP